MHKQSTKSIQKEADPVWMTPSKEKYMEENKEDFDDLMNLQNFSQFEDGIEKAILSYFGLEKKTNMDNQSI